MRSRVPRSVTSASPFGRNARLNGCDQAPCHDDDADLVLLRGVERVRAGAQRDRRYADLRLTLLGEHPSVRVTTPEAARTEEAFRVLKTFWAPNLDKSEGGP